jgi:ubiquinone/menaquinone biosynthesis C-methylase UbiE
MSLDTTASVKAFWEGRGLDPELAKELVTHPDRNQRLLEIEIALSYLPRGMRVLDVSCGNGFSTAIFARHASHVVGIDYAESMIARAQRDFGHLPNVEFQLQDVLNLDLSAANFDVVVSQRCLINLLSWEDQQQSIIRTTQSDTGNVWPKADASSVLQLGF